METINVSQSEEMKKGEGSPQKCRRGGSIVLLVSFLFGLFGGILGWWVGPRLASDLSLPLPPIFRDIANQKEKNTSMTLPSAVSSEEALLVDLVEKSTKAVVSVVITKDVPKYRSLFDNPGFPFFFGNPFYEREYDTGETERQTVGEGSGFFVSSNGTIVTNRHVVDEMQADYTVIMSDKKEYSARVLARDPVQDIAILKIEGDNFPALDLGDSDAVKVGQTAVAIGNSLGEFSNTVSRGIVSGLKRNLVAGSGFGASERLSGIIQTDAAINPGNSGGPLLDLSGKVIGVNVAMAQGAQNIGFAIPVNSIKNALKEVKETGRISSPFLGVRYALITPEIQKENNLPFEYGALVVRGQKMTDLAVVPGSPADKAGIVENDIILEIDGIRMDEENQLGDIIGTKRSGDTITLKLWRKGDTKEVKVTLEERK
jgi:serine protease Do